MVLIRKKKNNLYEWLTSTSFELEVLLDKEDNVPKAAIKPDIIESRPSVQPVIPKSSPKSFSIKNALEGKIMEEPQKVDPLDDSVRGEDILEEDSEMDESIDNALIFNQLDIERQWQQFIQSYLSEKPRYASLLNTYLPLLENDFQVKVVFESQLQIDMFGEIKNELTHFLRVKLNNKGVNLVTSMEVQENSNGKIYTVEDKYKYLSQLNPKLISLKQQLNLDFD